MKAAILAASLMPLEDSTPLDTSTAQGRTRRIAATALVGIAQLVQRVAQRLGNEYAAIGAEVTARVGQVIHLHV